MGVLMRLFMIMMMAVAMAVFVVKVMREVDIKLHAVNRGLLLARNVQMIAVQFEFFQLAFQLVRVHAEVEQRGDEHVAGDAAENIEVKNFHFSNSALIWLAA
jgi:hypothetical protein